MKMKKYLLAFTVAFILICVGIQAINLLETDTMPSKVLEAGSWEVLGGGNTHPNGDGGDPVDGPGWPK